MSNYFSPIPRILCAGSLQLKVPTPNLCYFSDILLRLNWLLVVIVPDAYCMEPIHANTLSLSLLSLAAFAMVTGVNLAALQGFIQSLKGLHAVVKAFTREDWKPIGELWQLTQGFLGVGLHLTMTLPVAEGSLSWVNGEQSPVASLSPVQSLESSIDEHEISNQGQLTPELEALTEPLKILIVEDDPVTRQVLVNYLVWENYQIAQVSNGIEALNAIENGFTPDLVLLDIMMPNMSGYEVCQKLRERFLPSELPILLLTAKKKVKDMVTGLSMGANDYLTKPVSKNELLLRVKTHLNLAVISKENTKLYSEVRASERRLTQFLEAVPVGVAVMDAEGKVHYINQKGQELLGKGLAPDTTAAEISEVYQLYIAGTDQVYPSENLPIVRALKGETASIDDIEIHQGDKIVPIEAWGTPIFGEQGNVAYAIVAFQDIRERKQAEAERQRSTNELFRLNQAYERFVPRQFLQLLNKESIVDVQLGDNIQQEMTVLFSDIRDFTPLSERLTPQDNFKFINAFLSRMEPAIRENKGFIDKFIGDGIMALFSSDADDAVKAGIAMLHRLSEYNQHRANSGYEPIKIGIGINTGTLMLGTVGGWFRMDSTVISDGVNLASRIEGITKDYEVSLLISHHTFLRLHDSADYAIRLIDRVKVKGKSELVTVYEVFDADPPEVQAAKLATKTEFEEGLLLYYCDRFAKAAQLFAHCLSINPEDRVAQIYLERCHQQIDEGSTPKK